MKGIGFAPSPIWYFSKVSDCNSSGIFAFGARQAVYMIDLVPPVPVYADALFGHTERVVGLKFCPNLTRPFELVSVDEGGTVKIWDISAKSVLTEFNVSKNKTTCIDWTNGESDIITTGDDKGVVCRYNSHDGKTEQHLPVRGYISALLSHYDENLLVIGFREGLILVLNLRTFSVSYNLRRHESDVQCLCWIPESFNLEIFARPSDPSENKNLFASSSKDGTIRVWNASKGRLLNTVKIPSVSGYRSRFGDSQVRSRLWSALLCSPALKDSIICSGYGGELLQCNFQENGDTQWELINKYEGPSHQNIIFNISCYKSFLCTTSIDRQIIIWDVSCKKSLISFPTLGGFVYCTQFSSVDFGFLAVGAGDNFLRIWNLQSSELTYQVEILWQGIKAKITAISWHPQQEGILAFGTEEGRVGIFNLTTGSRVPKVSDTFHRSTVYSISWGPVCGVETKSKNSKNLHLYSCGSGDILIHNPKNLQESAVNFNKIISSSSGSKTKQLRSEVSWRDDRIFLAVGNEDGSIEIFKAPDLITVLTITEIRTQIQCLCWHPLSVFSGNDISECKFWLAATACGPAVHLYDLKQEIENLENNTVISGQINKTSFKLHGHKNRVVSVCWNPHTKGQLASASYDGTGQIWDVLSQKPLGNFRGHKGRLFSIAWSHLDPDIIFSGGDDFTLQQWNISKQENLWPPKKALVTTERKIKKPKKTARSPAKSASPADTATSEIPTVDDLQSLLESKKEEILNRGFIQAQTQEGKDGNDRDIENVEEQHIKMKDAQTEEVRVESPVIWSRYNTVLNTDSNAGYKKKRVKRRYKSIFPISSTMEHKGKSFTLDDIHTLFNTLYPVHCTKSEQESDNELSKSPDITQTENEERMLKDVNIGIHLGLFSTRSGSLQMLNAERDQLKLSGNWDNAMCLEIWKGNIGKAIEIACETKQLTDWLVALAPMASEHLWDKACRAFAKQLVNEGQPLRACLYLLAIHDVYGAIDVLRRHASFKEALCLARARLSPDDPKLHEILTEWTETLVKEENFEGAAKCLISLGNFKEAIVVLSKRLDPPTLKLAASLSRKMGDIFEAESLAWKSLFMYLQKYDCDSAFELVAEHSALQNCRIFVGIFKLIRNKIDMLKNDPTFWHLDSFGSDYLENICLWIADPTEKSIVYLALEECRNQGWLPSNDSKECEKLFSWFQSQDDGGRILLNAIEVTIRCAYHLTLAVLSLALENVPLLLFNIMKVLSICEQEQSSVFLQLICCLIFPHGLVNISDFVKAKDQCDDSNPPPQIQLLLESLKAYLGLTNLHFLKRTTTVLNSPNTDTSTQEAESRPISFSKDNSLDENQESFIHKLKSLLLIDSRAQYSGLHLEFLFVNKAIAQKIALRRMDKTSSHKSQKLSSCKKSCELDAGSNEKKVPVSSINENSENDGQSSDLLLSESVQKETEDNEFLNENETSSAEKNETLLLQEKEDVTECENSSMTTLSDATDYLKPCDERYINVELEDLQKEYRRIENCITLMEIPKEHQFPDPIKSAEILVDYCQTNNLENLKNEIIAWIIKHAVLGQTRAKFKAMSESFSLQFPDQIQNFS